MHIVIVILGVLLFPKASALKCYVARCTSEKACTETKQDCPASQLCGARLVRSYTDEIIKDVKIQSCMASARCGLSGSTDFGIASSLVSSKCCSTDLCNDQYPTLPAKSSSHNGKKCYTCKGEDCSDILSCSGDQDHCISIRVAFWGIEKIMKGCVAKSLCVSSSDVETIPGMSTHSRCCEGDLCNDATSTAVSLLLLLAAVVSVALFN